MTSGHFGATATLLHLMGYVGGGFLPLRTGLSSRVTPLLRGNSGDILMCNVVFWFASIRFAFHVPVQVAIVILLDVSGVSLQKFHIATAAATTASEHGSGYL